VKQNGLQGALHGVPSCNLRRAVSSDAAISRSRARRRSTSRRRLRSRRQAARRRSDDRELDHLTDGASRGAYHGRAYIFSGDFARPSPPPRERESQHRSSFPRCQQHRSNIARNLSIRMRRGVREPTVAGPVQSSRHTGSVKVNVEPASSSLFTQIRPPWSSMNFRDNASPRPVPSTFLSAVPTCRNSSKTAS
jgi:hypothetical protein